MINEILKDLQSMDKPFIDEYILDKKNTLAGVDRQISNLKNIQIQNLKNHINYVEKIQLQRLDEQIKYMENDTIVAAKRELKNLEQYKNNLKSYKKMILKTTNCALLLR